MRITDLFAFVRERHMIFERRAAGLPKPWTQDTILQKFRFCNVYRELDTVTQWITKNWRTPHRKNPDLWFAMVVARLLNWPATLQELGYPAPWDGGKRFLATCKSRSGAGEKVFSGAYIVSTNGHTMPKPQYLVQHVLNPLWKERTRIQAAVRVGLLANLHEVLCEFNGLGSFMAAQVVADLKYTEPLLKAQDWWQWAASGPGSRRGLNRLLGHPVDAPWNEERWLTNLQLATVKLNVLVRDACMQRLHAQDVQNCLCEFDKYERVRLGEGRPRSLYPGV
jgi:hypothetical protein